MTRLSMKRLLMKRLGVIMEPASGDPNEVEGVLNPAAARGPDGHLYLFPRLVAKGNYSRIGIARVIFGDNGDPVGVERLGVALEPEADYELAGHGIGGCEDARINYVEPLGHYVMTYTALSARGPRIAIARSDDLLHWERVGLARFTSNRGIDVDGVDNKDAAVFPVFIEDPRNIPSIAMLHRPLFPGTRPEERVKSPSDAGPPMLQNMWISYWHTNASHELVRPGKFVTHRLLAKGEAPWETLKIGCGTAPVDCGQGWLIVYHGVHETGVSPSGRHELNYSAGIMILDREHPHRILYRSPEPVLFPETDLELHGAVDSVVFPTGIDRRTDIGQPDRYDVYYGMADDRIGVASLQLPPSLARER
ncbi:MAG TPA: hypothetical protein VMU59_12795 [Caulobacteraceae bacterium]|nr:hypothetical protein [Caulobacteraceae bacterium]